MSRTRLNVLADLAAHAVCLKAAVAQTWSPWAIVTVAHPRHLKITETAASQGSTSLDQAGNVVSLAVE